MIKQYFSILFIPLIYVLYLSFLLIPQVYAERGVKIARPVNTERRIALVIGNSAYKSSPLRNPVNDATDMATKLRRLGFQVSLGKDLSRKEMRTAIRKFGDELKRGGVGLFYYAGHGMQTQGKNYLIPVGSNIEREDEIQDEAIDAGSVLRKMEYAGNAMNMVFLDACRNNPFARSFRAINKGLAQMDAPSGSLIVYATAPGSVAADGVGRNGIFTKNLLEYLETPNLPVNQILMSVRKDVRLETDVNQTPWESSSLTGDFYFRREKVGSKGPSSKIVSSPVVRPLKTMDAEEELWKALKDSDNQEDIKMYLDEYPQGRFAVAARVKIKQLKRKQLAMLKKSAPSVPSFKEIARAPIKANKSWQSSGAIVQKENTYKITASGKWRHGNIPFFPNPWFAPDGVGSNNINTIVKDISTGTLIARIGNNQPFAVGSSLVIKADSDGILFFRMNDTILFDNEGEIEVVVENSTTN
tara:strand:+ start:330 stop:1742 length:1413 start_codon:yes stop_codon:yes gene_type:complete